MRVFVGCPIECAELERARSLWERQYPDWRWVDPSQLHVTLAFLGETRPASLDPINEASDRAAANRGGAVAMAGPRRFPPRRGRLLAMECVDGSWLADVAKALRDALRVAGITFDAKPFRPHVTVARPRRRGSIPDHLPPESEFIATVNKVQVIRSHLQAGGARHAVLHESPLRCPHAEPRRRLT